MYATENRDLKFGMDGTVQVGVFDTWKSDEYVIGIWELFVMLLCIIYIRCDFITGAFTCLMASTQFAVIRVLIDADKGETPLFGGNLWTITLYLYLFGWTTQFVGHGIFEQRKPALLSNGFFALIAPFFMVFEVLHKVTGYKNEELKQLNFVIEADIADYRLSSGIKMREGI
jgi:uncharacterized membrane protein YGL010W